MAIGYAPTTPVSTIIAVTPTVLITLDPSAPLTLIRNSPVASPTSKQGMKAGRRNFQNIAPFFIILRMHANLLHMGLASARHVDGRAIATL
jgi:hypothetical protein